VIPHPWPALVITLGAYRLLRLLGWDTFPLAVRARAWVIGDNKLLTEMFGCPFCLGFWVSLAVYLAWLWQPTGTLYAAAPFALSGAIGLISKNLDE